MTNPDASFPTDPPPPAVPGAARRIDLRSECPPCSGWADPTGNAFRNHQEMRTYIEFKCRDCGYEFDSWRPEFEDSGLAPSASSDATVVHERGTNNDIIFGFLTFAFGLALFLGHRGAQTDAGRLTIDILFGLLTLGTLAVWIAMRRNPARLEVTREAVTLVYKKEGKRSQQLLHAFGELAFEGTGGRYPRFMLRLAATASGAIDITNFDRAEVQHACESRGWQFIG